MTMFVELSHTFLPNLLKLIEIVLVSSIVLYQLFTNNNDNSLQILLIVSLSLYLFGFCFIFFIVDQDILQKAQDRDVEKLIGNLK
jgi:hypothetical protein